MDKGIDEKTKVPTKSQKPKKIADDFSVAIGKIQNDIIQILEKQEAKASPEFNALMEGYVSKANETERLKAKQEHLEAMFEDIKLENKNLRDKNQQISSDLNATRDALRQSEADLHHLKEDFAHHQSISGEKIQNLTEDKARLKEKIKYLNEKLEVESKEATQQITDLNEEIEILRKDLIDLEYNHRKVDQEKDQEIEGFKANLREHKKIITELKEQLELRTKEIEYKDSLLNQLIKQAATDGHLVGRVEGQNVEQDDQGEAENIASKWGASQK